MPRLSRGKKNQMKVTELLQAVDLLRKAGWTVEPPPVKRRTVAKRAGRPNKNGRRKRGRRRKETAPE
jgi:hypothetical protein